MQLKSSMVAPEFGEVNVHRNGRHLEIELTILMEPQGDGREGWQTGVALDASVSMQRDYGRMVQGKLPQHVLAEFEKLGWVSYRVTDKKKVVTYRKEAREYGLQSGDLKRTPNVIQPEARKFISYLSDLDADGGTTLIYWACGDGSQYEVAGDFTKAESDTLIIEGPKKVAFGSGTRLQPAIEYFVERFRDAKRGMYVFITDGELDDLDRVKAYTTQLARDIQAGRRNFIKCVLVGLGADINERQMEELDDLDTGTDVDLWDHKIAREMRSLSEIFAEVVDENTMVADFGVIYASDGSKVHDFSRGLPAKLKFNLPASSRWFELEVPGQRIKQQIV